MQYITVKTNDDLAGGSTPWIPAGVNLDNVMLMLTPNASPGNITIYPVNHDHDQDVNYYTASLNSTTTKATPINVGTNNCNAIKQFGRVIKANPNDQYLECVGVQDKTGEAVLWSSWEYED